MKKIIVNKNLIFQDQQPSKIIAEISCNHNGKKDLLIKHILKAHESGADLIKIQTYEADDICLETNNVNFKIKKGIWRGKYLWDLYKKAQTPYEWHKDIFNLAKKKKINLFSTPFSPRAVDFLEEFKVPIYKISSFEITDINLIKKVAKTRKPVIISTGMATEKEIMEAIKIVKKYHNKIILLHCVSGYPTPENEAHLSRMNLLKKKFKNTMIGLSDHTNDIKSSIIASTLGATVIEKHFILSKKIKSEDNSFSITPNQLKNLKEKIIKNHRFLGNEKFQIKKSEEKSINFRRSLFAKRNLKKNQILKKNDIISLRPKIGLSANQFENIIGKKIKIGKKKNSPIFKSDFF